MKCIMRGAGALGLAAALMAAGTGTSWALPADPVVVDESFVIDSYPESLMKIIMGTADYEEVKDEELHYAGSVDVHLELSSNENCVALLQNDQDESIWEPVIDGKVYMNMELKPEKPQTGEMYPSYHGSMDALVTLKSPEEAGYSISLGETKVTPHEDGTAELVTQIKEKDGKPCWVFFRQVTGDGEYGEVRNRFVCSPRSAEIYDTAYSAEEPVDISYEILGVVPFEPFNMEQETVEGTWEEQNRFGMKFFKRENQIQFEELVTGLFLVQMEGEAEPARCAVVDSNCIIMEQTYGTEETTPEELETIEAPKYKIIGFAPADVDMHYSFDRIESLSWGDLFTFWEDGSPEEVFAKRAAEYLSYDQEEEENGAGFDTEEDSETEGNAGSEDAGAEGGEDAESEDGSGSAAAADTTVYTDAETVTKVQSALNAAGYDCGVADGIAGENTRNAMKRYQTEHGLTVTDEITGELLQEMGL